MQSLENWSIRAKPVIDSSCLASLCKRDQFLCLFHIQVSQRIQKLLAHLGVASRRQIECWIEAGEVLVNGECCALGQHVRGDERVSVCGTPVDLQARVPVRVLLYHKPVGEIVSRREPQQRATIFDQLPDLESGRWVSVGRLDLNTSGMLLLTTDGMLAHALMHPAGGLEREYRVRVHGTVTHEILSCLQQGVQLEDGIARLTVLDMQKPSGTNTWCRVMLTEGRNRIVRRLWASQGLEVNRLVRTRYGPLALPATLRPGEWIELPASQIGQLYRAARCDSGS